jgi:lysophospholipase L1-like esterase
MKRFNLVWSLLRTVFFGGLLLIIFICSRTPAPDASWRWHNPAEAGFKVIRNQAWPDEIGERYVRLPDRAQDVVRPAVWNLSRQSAGLAVHFYSNAPEIKVRYMVTGAHSMPHMTALGVSGVDLYGIDSDGAWNFNFGSYSFKDTISYHYRNISAGKYHQLGYEYRLYLPLYNAVKWLEIGTPDSATFQFLPLTQDLPIVVYGTSIAQGACASRPAMGWTNILERAVDHPVVNLGFSGNGRMETPLIDLIAEIDAHVYVLDCLPNLTGTGDEEVYNLLTEGVKRLRAKRGETPILMIEHIGYSNARVDTEKMHHQVRLNRICKEAFSALTTEGVEGLHYLSCEKLGIPPDGWVDYIHLSDLGMQRQADVVEEKIREILREPKGDKSTTRPVTQRREPYKYEWRVRHEAILALHKTHPPKAVILGNSITHFWGGQPEGPHKNGTDSWAEFMEPAGYQNLGYGWDRIENVLWRIYHGEIDSPSIRKITVMIGTNNLGLDTEDDLIEGLAFLIDAIRLRKPGVAVKVAGLLPRKGMEAHVASLNRRIQQIAADRRCVFADPGVHLLDETGKIVPSYFSDGLHPNEKGYRIIAKEIAE